MSGPGLRALVLGGSGEIGRQLVQELINSPGFSHVTLVTRRELDFKNEKVEQKLVDFEDLDNHRDAFENVQVCIFWFSLFASVSVFFSFVILGFI